MPTPARVPPELTSGPFLGSEAVARRLLGTDQLRSVAWRRLLRGVYVHADVEVTDEVRFAALRLVMPPGGVVHGLLAAWLHGVWVPRPGRIAPLDVSRPVTGDGAPAKGQNRRRLTFRCDDEFACSLGYSAADRDVVERDGVHVTSPLRTCFDLMRERGLVEAVVVADAFLQTGLPDWLLAAYVQDRRRWPGIRQTRVAVGLARPGSRSPGESRLRMVVVLAGLPEPWINVPMLRAASESVIGIPDLTVPGERPVGLEYDGAYHEDAGQAVRDRRRSNRMTTVGNLPLLRYDRVAVRYERRTILDDIYDVTGLKAPSFLDDADFYRPRQARAW